MMPPGPACRNGKFPVLFFSPKKTEGRARKFARGHIYIICPRGNFLRLFPLSLVLGKFTEGKVCPRTPANFVLRGEIMLLL
jgi:hypothetical protein